MSITAVRKDQTPDLKLLAERITAAHVGLEGAFKNVIIRCVELGKLLITAKDALPHGQWESWIADNTPISPRTARSYMQIARFWDEADEPKRRHIADLNLRELLDELANPKLRLTQLGEQSGPVVSITAAKDAETEPDDALRLGELFAVDTEKMERRFSRLRDQIVAGEKPRIIDKQSDEAILSSNTLNLLASLRLLGKAGPAEIAETSRLDDGINLEELAGLLSDAASHASKL